jgi:caffeoyl-CoA O-methyltransferase
MFHEISAEMLARMRELEAIDERDRNDGTHIDYRMRQVPPETGRFIALLAAGAPNGAHIEIGTSAGYSTLWQALALRARPERTRRIITFEVLENKIAMARETFRLAGVEDLIEIVHADARTRLERFDKIGFCFLDAEKNIYRDCYELVVPRLVPGGLLVADNIISHQDELQALADYAVTDPRVDAMVVPIAKGELVCRKK